MIARRPALQRSVLVALTLSSGLSSGLSSEPAVAAALPSGTAFLGETLQTQQRDPAANPGMLWVSDGAALWQRAAGASGRSCADCHGDAERSMRGVATRYPAYQADADTLLNLEGRINRCRTEHQQAPSLRYESDPLLALTAFVARQSLGLPMAVSVDGAAAPWYQRGQALFHQRQGQLNLSCAQCHVQHAGERLRGDTISHGLGVGYPAYRLEWQTLGSLHRRLRACSLGVRAVQFDFGSSEYLSLELFLAERATSTPVETPAIRR